MRGIQKRNKTHVPDGELLMFSFSGLPASTRKPCIGRTDEDDKQKADYVRQYEERRAATHKTEEGGLN